jgi:outer membrane protein TolC
MIWVLAAAAQDLAAYQEAAVRSHPRIKVADAATQSARAQREQAQGALLPTLSLSAGWTHNQYDAVVEFPDGTGGTDEVVIVPKDQYDGALALRVPIVDATSWARRLALGSGVEAADLDREVELSALRMDVARAWYGAIAAQQVAGAAEKAKAAAEDNRRFLAARAAAGVATALAVQRAELEVANAERLLIEARRVRGVAVRSLASLSGLPEPAELPTATREPELPDQGALAAAEARRPEVAAAQARVDQVRQARNSAWLAWTPVVAGTATERYSNASGFSGEETSWNVGVGLTWELLDFGDRTGAVRAARAELAAAEARLSMAKQAVRDEVRGAVLAVESSRAAVEAARRGATVAAATSTEVRARFQAGTTTQLEVVQADRDALQADVERIRAEGELAVAGEALRRAVGL